MPKIKSKKTRAALAAEQKAREEEEERKCLMEAEENRKRQIEEDKKRQFFIQKRNEKFEQNEKEMNVISNERESRYINEKKFIDAAEEWKKTLSSCNETVSKDVDEISLNSFLYEYRVIKDDDEDVGTNIEDFINFCSDVEELIFGLNEEILYYQSSKNAQLQQHDLNGIKSKATEFIEKTHILLQEKIDVMTMNNNIRLIDEFSTEGAIGNTHHESTSGFGMAFYEGGIENNGQESCTMRKILHSVDIGISCSVRKSFTHGMVARVVKLPLSLINTNDKSNFDFVNNIYYHVNVLPLSSTSKKVGNWMVDCHQRSISYSKSKFEGSIKVCINLHKSVNDSILGYKLVRLNDDRSQWTEDGLSNITFDEERNKIEFDLLSGLECIVTVVKPKQKGTIYEHWKIQQVKACPNLQCNDIYDKVSSQKDYAVEVSVKTRTLTVNIQVLGHECFLVEPQQHAVKDLLYKPYSPERLLLELEARGIHLLPTKPQDDADIGSSCKLKVQEIENRFAEDISLLCFAYEVENSPHNEDFDSLKALYRVRESNLFTGGRCNFFPTYQMVMEYDHEIQTCPISRGVFCSISNIEESTAYSNDPLSLMNLFPCFTMEKLSSKEVNEKVFQSSPHSSEVVCRLLKVLNLISFCG